MTIRKEVNGTCILNESNLTNQPRIYNELNGFVEHLSLMVTLDCSSGRLCDLLAAVEFVTSAAQPDMTKACKVTPHPSYLSSARTRGPRIKVMISLTSPPLHCSGSKAFVCLCPSSWHSSAFSFFYRFV